MAEPCVFYSLKIGKGSENKSAEEQFNDEKIVIGKRYCKNNDCPSGSVKSVYDKELNGFIPLTCCIGMSNMAVNEAFSKIC